MFTCLSWGGGGGGGKGKDTQEACPGGDDTQKACPGGCLHACPGGEIFIISLSLGAI